MNTRRTAALMIAAAVLVNVAFTGLAAVFDYPDVLKQPADEVLASFRASQFAITVGFLALAIGAAMLAPVAVGVGRLSSSRAMRWAVPVGIAAAVVQVVGLLRWPLLVPGWAATAAGDDPAAAAAAREAFGAANRVLGTLIGETGGYLLTAGWTGLVLAALGTAFGGRLFVALGAVAAALVLLGVLSPLNLPLVDTANFVGYILWSAWLVVFAVVLVLRQRRRAGEPVVTGASRPPPCCTSAGRPSGWSTDPAAPPSRTGSRWSRGTPPTRRSPRPSRPGPGWCTRRSTRRITAGPRSSRRCRPGCSPRPEPPAPAWSAWTTSTAMAGRTAARSWRACRTVPTR